MWDVPMTFRECIHEYDYRWDAYLHDISLEFLDWYLDWVSEHCLLDVLADRMRVLDAMDDFSDGDDVVYEILKEDEPTILHYLEVYASYLSDFEDE